VACLVPAAPPTIKAAATKATQIPRAHHGWVALQCAVLVTALRFPTKLFLSDT
jgi:hypothetical protein